MWVKTLNGDDVFDNQDGWIFWARTQGWTHEPDLLTMPAVPTRARMANEVDRLTHDWPTLKEAWAWKGPYSGGLIAKAARVFVLFAGFWNLCMIPLWFTGLTGMHNWGETANSAAIHGILFGVIALFCLFGIWHSHVWRRDPHKGLLVAGAVQAACAASRIDRRLKAYDAALDRGRG